MKKITILYTVALLLSSSVAFAQSSVPQSAYQAVAFLPANGFTIPTLIEIPFTDESLTQNSFLVVESQSGSFLPHYWRDQPAKINTPIQITSNGQFLGRLNDGNQATNESFAVFNGERGVLYLDLKSNQEFTTSEIAFSFDRNVTPPQMVTVYAIDSNNTQTVVLARTNFTGNRALIPRVTTKTLQVVLEYYQPLRINEISIVEEGQPIEASQGLRFLAAPGETYEIYVNPDRAVSVNRNEAGNLRSNQGVVTVAAPSIIPNPQYRESDRDNDGRPDEIDNCPDLSNPDQADENTNGVGDVCDDYDKDGVINSQDNCRDNPNSNQADDDGDTIGDVCDDSESRITEKYDWALWVVMGLAGVIIVGLFVSVARRDPALIKSETNNEGDSSE